MDVNNDLETQQCLFHSIKWRNKFQSIMNNFGRKIFPRKYLDRITKVVCTCKNGKGLPNKHFDDYRTSNMSSLREYFKSEFSKSQLTGVEVLIMECTNTDRDVTFQSRWRFLVLVKQCLLRDYKLLNFNQENISPYVRNLTSNDKYHFDSELEVSFPLEYIPFIMGSKGQHIRRICTHYNCEIRLQISRYRAARLAEIFPKKYPAFNRPGKESTSNCRKVTLCVFYNSVETLADVRDALCDHIVRTVNKRERHQLAILQHMEKTTKYKQQKYENRKRQMAFELKHGYRFGPTNAWGAAANRKASDMDSYHVKQQHRNKDKKRRKPPVYLGGVCRNCLVLYKKHTFEKDACKYHPGFLVDQRDYHVLDNLSEDLTISDISSESEKEEDVMSSITPPEAGSETSESNLVASQGITMETAPSSDVQYVWSCCGKLNYQPNNRMVSQECHQTGCRTDKHSYRLSKPAKPLGRKSTASKKKIDKIDM